MDIRHDQNVADPDDELRVREKLGAMYTEVGFHGGEAWKSAPAVFGEHDLQILGHPVMEDWEEPYMRKLAEIATHRAPASGGRILEIGYGMGLSARWVIKNPRVAEHVIVEANHEVAELARKFRDNQPPGRVRVVEGFSYDVVDQFGDGSFDGILHDAYPQDESEKQTQAHFASTAYRLLKPGGVFTYFSDEPTAYRPEHRAMLTAAGFDDANITSEIVDVTPPPDCRYWVHRTILAPIVVK